jgi:hypothetical protein
MWEKALLQWVSTKARPSTLCVDVAAEEHITYAINVAQLAVSVKPQLLDDTNGEQRLSKDKEFVEC